MHLDFNLLCFVHFRVAMRQQGDLIRTMYPKLILEGSATFGGHSTAATTTGGGLGEAAGTLPQQLAALKRPPLARDVHLTLGTYAMPDFSLNLCTSSKHRMISGVAVLGSLLGGVQLFAMIKVRSKKNLKVHVLFLFTDPRFNIISHDTYVMMVSFECVNFL